MGITGTTTPNLSGPGSNGNEEVLPTPQNWRLNIRCLLYPGHLCERNIISISTESYPGKKLPSGFKIKFKYKLPVNSPNY